MTDDLLDKAKKYRERASTLREKARVLSFDSARQAMLQAAATWDELADSAEREAGWRQFADRAPGDRAEKG
jgi:hypothetical protein